jgi:anti-anti-sigma factor
MTASDTFSVDCRRLGDALHIIVSGELDLASESPLVEAAESAMASADAAHVIIDLSGLVFADSSGLRGLLRCQDYAVEHSLPLTLAVPAGGFLDRLLDISGVRAWFSYE